MKTNLNIISVLKGKVGNMVNTFLPSRYQSVAPNPDYTLVKDLTPHYTKKKNRVGLYKSTSGQDVVIKRVLFHVQNLDALYLCNEASILETLTKKASGKISPRFIDFFTKSHEFGLVTQFVASKNLETLDPQQRSLLALQAFENLQEVSSSLSKTDLQHLPQRKPLYYLLSFPLNWIRVVAKNPKQIVWYTQLGILFYKSYFRVLFGSYTVALAHRDLYPDNILASEKGKLTIIDWESAVVTDSLYDLAMVAMIYTKEYGKENMLQFIQRHLASAHAQKRFVGLSIFNSIQILTNNPTKSQTFEQTEEFLQTLMNFFAPSFVYKKSLFEHINNFTLNCITLFYRLTRLPKHSKSKHIILCYHSVGQSGWRFSTSIQNFTTEIDFLRKNYSLLSLEELLKGKAGIHICFDDGYEDVKKNAFPLIKKYSIPATMFALADSKNANRKELDNTLPLMSDATLRLLRKNGWEIGCHTKTHPNLDTLSDAQLTDEIIGAKTMLEKKLGAQVKYFAYPKGIYSKKIMDTAQKAGYKAAFTVDGYDVQNTKNPMKISRVCLEHTLTPMQLEALLSPLGLLCTRVFITILKWKEKATRMLEKSFFIQKIAVIGLATLALVAVLILSVKGTVVQGQLLYQHDQNTQVGGPFEASNNTSRYALTEAIVNNKTFFLTQSLAQFASPDVVLYNGHFLSIFTPGVSFVGIPFFLLGEKFGYGQLFTYASTLLAGLINVFLITLIARKLKASFIEGLIGGAVYLLATNSLVYTQSFTQHQLSSLVILTSLLIAQGRPTKTYNILLGALFGIGLLVDIPNGIMMLPIMLYFFIKHIQTSTTQAVTTIAVKGSFVMLLVGLLPFLGLFAYYNYKTTGSFTKIGQTIGRTTAFATPQTLKILNSPTSQLPSGVNLGIKLPYQTRSELLGLYTLLLSDERAWIYYSPILLLACIGIFFAYKIPQKKGFTLACLGVVLLDIVSYSMFGDPWGGWAFGPRYLIPAAAVLCVFLPVAIHYLKRNVVFIILFVLLTTYSIYVNSLGALTTSSIPPKVEAVSLPVPIPYTYQYNEQFLQKNTASSLVYNALLARKMPAWVYLYIVICISSFAIFLLYLASLQERNNQT